MTEYTRQKETLAAPWLADRSIPFPSLPPILDSEPLRAGTPASRLSTELCLSHQILAFIPKLAQLFLPRPPHLPILPKQRGKLRSLFALRYKKCPH